MFKTYRVGIMIMVCILLFSTFVNAEILLDRVVAVVNQDVINWSELYRAMEADASPQVKELQKDEQRKVFKENEAAFLETLINVKLQLQEADKEGLKVSEDEIKGGVDGIKNKYSMSDDAFIESLKKEGFTLEEYKKRLSEQILISKLVNSQIRNKIVVTDEDLKKFVAENKELLADPDGYRISQILLKKQTDADSSKLEEKAGDLLKKIAQGVSFSDLAKQYSEDPSASSGGDLGILKKSQLNKIFSDILSQMKPGDVSKPFWTESGLHIIKLEAKTDLKNNNEILEEARNRLTDKIFKERYNAWIKSLREKSFIDVRL